VLGVLAKELGLPDPVMRVAIPYWVVAETINIGEGMSILLIYRSTYLRDTDPHYEEVRAIVERYDTEELYRRTREDEDMMHRSAEWIVYLCDRAPVIPPKAQIVIDLVAEWGDPLHPRDVPAAIVQRVRSLGQAVR
jgi:hypothetical protein